MKSQKQQMLEEIASLTKAFNSEKSENIAMREWIWAMDRGEKPQVFEVCPGLEVHVVGFGRSSGGTARINLDKTYLMPESVDELLSLWYRDSDPKIRECAEVIAKARDFANKT